MTGDVEIDPGLRAFVVEAGLAQACEPQTWRPIGGGVSSDIWRVEVGGRTFCVKRALAQLRVTAEWRAPVIRNLYEWRWFETVAGFLPETVPPLLAADHDIGVFAMSYLDEERHPIWKTLLLAGEANVAFAGAVGDRLGAIHAATAGRADMASRFSTDALFHALRLEPYLLATAERHAEVAGALRVLVDRTAGTRLALVHGDVSPKNILVGLEGPIFLDAECAWYGDPAFDLAFCLNHLLLKCLVAPRAEEALMGCFAALSDSYLRRVDWEPRDGIEQRAASLLPGLLLARVDGKSPVEYITETRLKDLVRDTAVPLLLKPPRRLADIDQAWRGRR